jgi:hypothetical protein
MHRSSTVKSKRAVNTMVCTYNEMQTSSCTISCLHCYFCPVTRGSWVGEAGPSPRTPAQKVAALNPILHPFPPMSA